MFGKKDSKELLNQSERSFIGESMQIEGDLNSSGAVDVAGLIKGNIHVKEMIIFDTGSVRGSLQSIKVNINGHVEGHIIGEEVILGKQAVIKGDVTFNKSLKTEEGAEIDGYVKGAKFRKNEREEEDKDIEEIAARTEFGKPKLVKGSK